MTTRHTARLVLRQWEERDGEPFAALNADPRVMEWFPAPLTRAESDAMVDRMRAHLDEHDWGLWALEHRGSGGLLGFVGLARPRFEAHFTPAVEVGWRLARTAWGQGFATEAASEALRVGFDELDLGEVVSFTAEGNARSRRVMERLGMTRAPEDDFDHPLLPVGHRLSRHVLYRLSRPR